MRIACLALVATCVALTGALGQDTGTLEVGFFGTKPTGRQVSRLTESTARVTLFVSDRFAVETQQTIGAITRQSLSSLGLWGLYARPITERLRLHMGPGVALRSSENSRVPKPDLAMDVGLRWTVHEWLGLRVDGLYSYPMQQTSGRRASRSEILGGLSIRLSD